jgi:hypothetical protein
VKLRLTRLILHRKRIVDEHSVLRLQEIRREGAHADELPVGADEHEECEEGEDVGLWTRQRQPLLREITSLAGVISRLQ